MPITDDRGVATLPVPEGAESVDVQATSAEGEPLPGIGLTIYIPPPPIPTFRLTADLGVPGDGRTPVSD